MHQVRLSPLQTRPQLSQEVQRCPRCGGERVRIHARRRRAIRDWAVREVQLVRLRCKACGTTWTVYPQGVAPGGRFSLRAEQLMVLLYMLGLSYRGVAAIMGALGVNVAASTVLNFVQAQGMREEVHRHRRYWQERVKVRRVGIDGTGVKMAGRPDAPGVLVVVDDETGIGLWVEAVDEQDPEALARFLTWVLETFQPEEVITDEGSTYPEALEQAAAQSGHEPAHRLCTYHFRRNKLSRLRRLLETAQEQGWNLVVMELLALEALLKRSPPEVWGTFACRLLRLVQSARPPKPGEQATWHYRFRMFLLELCEKAPYITGVTNNRTEQLIGRSFKIRIKSMRGFKRLDNRMRFLHLALALDERAQREGWLYLI